MWRQKFGGLLPQLEVLGAGAETSSPKNTGQTTFAAARFRRRPTEDIERQNNGQEEEEYVKPVVQHQIPQRTLLANSICTRIVNITPQDAIYRRIKTANLIQALYSYREVASRYRLRVALPPLTIFKEDSPEVGPLALVFPLVCSKTQCLFYIRDESKSYQDRLGSFCRPTKMMDHVKQKHLKGKDPKARIECYHPTYKSQGLVLEHLEHFKNHVQTVHGITLREPRFVRSTE